jgi:hypothetical protein
MKKNRKSILIAFVMCVLCIAPTLSQAVEPPKKEREILNNLLSATEKNDYKAFLKDATAKVKAALTKQMLEGVSSQVAPHMKKGYEVSYLGNLTQQGSKVYLWKLIYKDGHDDTLAKLVLKDGKVAGFWLQ